MKDNRSLPMANTLPAKQKAVRAVRVCRQSCSSLRASAALLCALLSLASPAMQAADANPPKALTYQGYLTDGSGNPLGPVNPANYDVVFKIYNASTGGVLKWAEKQTVTIDKGQFSVVLGEGAVNGSDPRPDLNTVFSAADASDRFIGITVKISGTDVDIAPRLRLVTSPYAFLAKGATALVGADGATVLAATSPGVMTVSGQLNATGFAGSGAGLTGLTASQIPTLDATKIATGILADARLSGSVPLLTGGKLADSVIPNPLSGKTFNSHMGLTAANTFEFGVGSSKEVNNGKIGYQTFSTGLDIVGAGADVANRRITFHAQGGSFFHGRIGVSVAPEFSLHTLSDLNSARARFQVGGSYADFGRWSNYLYVQLNNSVHSTDNRYASYDGDSNWDFNSDRRLKKDIEDVEPMLDRALKVQVRRYRWKEDSADAKHKLGVVAQELQPLFPDMVVEVESPHGKHEKTLSVGYSDFGVIAIKALQELHQIVEKKDARIAALEEKAGRIDSLESELAALKKQVAALAANANNVVR